MERIAPSAFTKTLKENQDRMRVLFEHGKDHELGSKPLGVIRSITETDHGAAYEVDLFEGIPPLVLNGLRHGQYGSSFRFSVVKQSLERNPEPSAWNPEGLPERTVTEARVHEFGPVTFPAYPQADAGIRSLTDRFVFPQDVFGHWAQRAATLIDVPEPAKATPAVVSRATPPAPRDYTRPETEVKESWRL
jgi:HK97 family phage prohead protease